MQFGYNLPLLIAFFLPFGINYAIFILVWTICFFAFDDLGLKFKKAFKNKWSFILLGFFLIHTVTYFFSSNKTEALSAIEIKLSFLAFPILIFASNYSEIQIRKIVISFVSGCLIVSFICIFKAFYSYIFNDINAFFYSDFSFFMHPSYFAMYLIFSLLIIILFYKTWLAHLAFLNVKMAFMSLVFLITIFFCSSKMGLITALLVLPLTFFIILFNQGYKKTIVSFILGLLVSIFVAYHLFPKPFERLKMAFTVTSNTQSIDKTDVESTAVRILIWNESLKLINENWLFGVTPGDANDQLLVSYQKEGLTGALSKRLNAHNQFLQTFIGTGLIGIALLCIMTFGALIFSFLKKNYILSLFCILIICNFMVESMLQAQAGFIFFVFFFCLLSNYNFHRIIKN